MPGSSKKQGQSKGPDTVTWRDFNLEGLKEFIEKAQLKDRIQDELIDSVTRNGQNVVESKKVTATTRKYSLRDSDQFGKEFLTGNAFTMCLMDIKTPEFRGHKAMAQALEDAFTSKPSQGGTVEDDNAWVVKVFYYMGLNVLTPSNILIILLKQIIDCLYKGAATKGKTLDPFKVRRIQSISKEYDEHQKRELDYQFTWEILKGCVKQILKQFPEITLTFIISGINPVFEDLLGLSNFVIMMGRLLQSINSVDNTTRTKCIFCGDAFQGAEVTWEDSQGNKGHKEFTPFLDLIIEQVMKQSKEAGQEERLKKIIEQFLVLRWSSTSRCFRRITFNAEIS